MNVEQVIYPTGHCFDDALDLLVALLKAGADPERLALVHGICLAPDGHHFAHAWVESTVSCLFRGLVEGTSHYFAVAHEQYYADARVQEVTYYSVREAWVANRRHGTYGPWIPRYKALCTQKQGAGGLSGGRGAEDAADALD